MPVQTGQHRGKMPAEKTDPHTPRNQQIKTSRPQSAPGVSREQRRLKNEQQKTSQHDHISVAMRVRPYTVKAIDAVHRISLSDVWQVGEMRHMKPEKRICTDLAGGRHICAMPTRWGVEIRRHPNRAGKFVLRTCVAQFGLPPPLTSVLCRSPAGNPSQLVDVSIRQSVWP